VSASADRNLLFGILALQNGFVSRDALVAGMNDWVLAKHRPLADILTERGALRLDHRALLDALVQANLALNGGDAQKSLAALSSLGPDRKELEQVADADVQASLGVIGRDRAPDADPYATVPPTAGQSTSQGLRFRVLRPHAEGGLGRVSVALDGELRREVALKEIKDKYADHPESRARFLLEAEVTGGLEHPGIVPVYGLGTYADGRPFYAMRFIKGDSLKEAVERFHNAQPSRFDSLAFRRLLGRFVDVCQAVAYAHSRGVLHRDLKPGNVMLGKYGETLLVDWGLAKPLGDKASRERERPEELPLVPSSASSTGETLPGSVIGTPQFMSPEQAAGRVAEIGPASDVYGLGAILYAVLTGQPPVTGDTTAVLDKVIHGDIAPPQAVAPGVPRALEAVCLKALALQPGDRYPSALALAADVEHFLADEPVTAWREPWGVRAWRWVRRHRTPVTSAAAAVLVGAAGLAAVAALLAVMNQRERDDAARIRREGDRALAALATAREAIDTTTAGVLALTGEALTSRRRLSVEEQTFLRGMVPFYQKMADEPDGGEADRERLALVHYRLGMIHLQLKQAAPGAEAFRRSAHLYAGLADALPDVPGHRRMLAGVYYYQGVLLRDLARYTEAEEVYRRAIAEARRLVGGSAEPVYRVNLAVHLAALGSLLPELNKWEEAEAVRRQALALREQLAAEHPDVPEYRQTLAGAYHDLANLLTLREGPAAAQADYRAARDLYRQLTIQLAGVPAQRDTLAHCYTSLGIIQATLKEGDAAEASYRAALQLREQLAGAHPGVPWYRQEFGQATSLLADSLVGPAKWAEAERLYGASLAVWQALADEQPGVPSYRRGLARAHMSLGAVLANRDRWDEARAEYQRAVALRERLAAELPGVGEYRFDYGYSCLLLGTLLRDRYGTDDDLRASLNWYTTAIDAFGAIRAGDYGLTATARSFLKDAYCGRAIVRTRLRQFRDAEQDWDRTLALVGTDRAERLRIQATRVLYNTLTGATRTAP
jgi:tetratricopeptide (TPR) repeat protein/tRNA A-37 threonylcarbamoyl transferase component Bud32